MQYKYIVEHIFIGQKRFSFYVFEEFERTLDRYLDTLQANDLQLTKDKVPLYGRIWPAAIALANVMEQTPQLNLSGKKVLEIGCGIALPSILATSLGAQTTALDYLPEIGDLLRQNYALNHVREIPFKLVDWHEPFQQSEHYDLILGADILYDPQYFDSLLHYLKLVSHHDSKILITTPMRTHYEAFITKARAAQYQIEISDEKALDSLTGRFVEIKLLRLTRR